MGSVPTKDAEVFIISQLLTSLSPLTARPSEPHNIANPVSASASTSRPVNETAHHIPSDHSTQHAPLPGPSEKVNPLPRGLVAGSYASGVGVGQNVRSNSMAECDIIVSVEDDEVSIEAPHSEISPVDLYRGNNILLCGGRWGVLGPNTGFCLLAECMILLPFIVYMIFVARHLSAALNIIAVIVCLVPVILLSKTASTDPGILRRYNTPPIGSPPPAIYVNFRGRSVRAWFCKACNTYRSPRAKHCFECNNCVEIFDHHCPWVGSCVGKNNYCHFLWFLTTTHLSAWYITGTICHYWLQESRARHMSASEFAKEASMVPVLILLVYMALVCFFVGGLTLYHYYLSLTAQVCVQSFEEKSSGVHPRVSTLIQKQSFQKKVKLLERNGTLTKVSNSITLTVIQREDSPWESKLSK